MTWGTCSWIQMIAFYLCTSTRRIWCLEEKRGNPSSSSTLNAISIEPLRKKGVPLSLCDLIGNMLDIINGNLLTKDEAYRTMSDVWSDLQLPNAGQTGFGEISGHWVATKWSSIWEGDGRTALQDSYMRSISGENKCAVIVGPSGIEKMILANRLGRVASAWRNIFLNGEIRPTSANGALLGFIGFCFGFQWVLQSDGKGRSRKSSAAGCNKVESGLRQRCEALGESDSKPGRYLLVGQTIGSIVTLGCRIVP